LLKKTEVVKPNRDGKLAELKSLIAAKASDPTTNRDGKLNRKVLIFTAFSDTAQYLYREVAGWARKELGIHTALVRGDGANQASLGRSDYVSVSEHR